MFFRSLGLGVIMGISILNPSHSAQLVDWGQFTSSVVLEIARGEDMYTCSGVAISRNIVLTAAHCVENMDRGRVLWGPTYNKAGPGVLIKDIMIHHGYDSSISNFRDDIALVQLAHNLPSHIGPIEIDKKSHVGSASLLSRIGYGGREGENNKTWTCPVFFQLDRANKVMVSADELAVLGDSGGGIYLHQSESVKLVGIHSTLEGKNKAFSVYVPMYRSWIEQAENYWEDSSSSMQR